MSQTITLKNTHTHTKKEKIGSRLCFTSCHTSALSGKAVWWETQTSPVLCRLGEVLVTGTWEES